MQTAERVSQSDRSDNFVFARSLKAYMAAAERVVGEVLEIGTGSGYGIEIIAPKATRFTTIDKHCPAAQLLDAHPEVEFCRMTVPPLTGFADESFDAVVSFQVIEHIANDGALVDEVWRVLRPGGRFIVSTPNRPMSLTRNPWHVKEYSAEELTELLTRRFGTVEAGGVTGNERVAEYYERNRASVARFARLDILDLQHKLPRKLFRLPYDILNRINRRRLLHSSPTGSESFSSDDYSVAADTTSAYDLFFEARK